MISSWSSRSRWTAKAPAAATRSWVRLRFQRAAVRRGRWGTIEAPWTETAIWPLRTPPCAAVTATSGVQRRERARAASVGPGGWPAASSRIVRLHFQPRHLAGHAGECHRREQFLRRQEQAVLLAGEVALEDPIELRHH